MWFAMRETASSWLWDMSAFVEVEKLQVLLQCCDCEPEESTISTRSGHKHSRPLITHGDMGDLI